MNLYGVALSDAIKSSDTLFQQVRVERQVKQDQMLSKLEVSAFTANL